MSNDKIIVTGLPRCMTSLLVNSIADRFDIPKPDNKWGETHKFGESSDTWISSKSGVFKLWKPYSENFTSLLESTSCSIVVSYTTDMPLWIAKLFRSHITGEWGISRRDKDKVSFKENINEFDKLPIEEFRDGLHSMFSSKRVILKSIFVKDGLVSTHIQSSVSEELVSHVKSVVSGYVKPDISEYIIEDEDEYRRFIYNKFGNTI